MTRSHRSAHRALWILVAIAIAFGLGAALLRRAPAKVATLTVISEAHFSGGHP